MCSVGFELKHCSKTYKMLRFRSMEFFHLSKIPLGVKPKGLPLEQLGRSLYTLALAFF